MIYPKGKLRLEEKTMTVTLTLNEITTEQAEKVLDLLHDEQNTEIKATKPAKKSKPAESVGEIDEYEEFSPAKELAEETEEVSATIEEVRAALAKLSKSKGKERAKEILSKFGVSKVTELAPEQYGAVMKEIG